MQKSNSRLGTLDDQGDRLWVYPSDVFGKFRRRRTGLSTFLILVFLTLPWLRIGGSQAFFLDILNGRFTVFGIQFWSHDAPMLLFVFGGAAIALAFVTSVWGRVWCGWACPQTVFVEFIFRKIERAIEGDAVTRRRLDQAPPSIDRSFKKILKWICYVLISLVLSHSFLAYFIGTQKLTEMMTHSPGQNLGSFIAMAGMSAAVLFDFGWLREQFCTLLCPYGRFQSVLMDEGSLAVTYDQTRSGDCINCRKCVQVCPTGIDIRNGLQLECVACTSCIDACDGVMEKIEKPKGLIRYSSGWKKGQGISFRPMLYFFALSVLIFGLFWSLKNREVVETTLIRNVGAPFSEVVRPQFEKEIVNHFHMDLLNQSFDPIRVEVTTPAETEMNGIQIVSAGLPVQLSPGERRRVDLFVRFPVSKIKEGHGKAHLNTRAISSQGRELLAKTQEVPLVGPLR